MEVKPVRMSLAVLVLGLGLVVAKPLFAQDGKNINIYLSGAANEGLSDLGERVNTGFGGTAGLGVIPRPLSSGDIEFIFNLAYDQLPSNSDYGADFSFLRVGLDFKLRWWPSRSSSPYFVLGGGVSFNKWSSFTQRDGTAIDKLTETQPYIAPGAGIEFRQRKISPFFDLRLISISGQRIGDYRYGRASVGLMF